MNVLLVVAFGLTWWLGLYVVAREPRSPVARLTGIGLIAYALALGVAFVDRPYLAGLQIVLIAIPPVAWAGVCLALVPGGERFRRFRRWVWLPLTALVVVTVALLHSLNVSVSGMADEIRANGYSATVLSASPDGPEMFIVVDVEGPFGAVIDFLMAALGPWVLRFTPDGEPGLAPGLAIALAVVLLVPLAYALVRVVRAREALRPRPAGWLLLLATLFFGLGAALTLAPVGPLGNPVFLLMLDFDLLLLGVAIAMSNAFEAGETLRRDMLRSLLAAAVVAAVFGGQVGLVMLAQGGSTPALAVLLLGSVAAATAVQVLSGPLHAAFDRLALPKAVARETAELRESAEALPRRDESAAPMAYDEVEFAKLTRRALANYGDLAKLMSSPLVNLPEVDVRLARRGAPDQPLERAAELKAILLEAIGRLKPRDGDDDFGTSEEWRYYNALYWPYVAGIRPYRRGASRTGLGPTEREAFDWFIQKVPERTLYNWQNAAAKLVAADLRQGLAVNGSDIGSGTGSEEYAGGSGSRG
ncbi:hypothetical protein [Bailinhaonella thermotolerans]|uniref:Transmembrane protein n=1 Tax=Bailinhaonella thermotolerans TaxID=1070861 RepID=A0A3A4BFD3_9ACTN|nr:hypothetical protein [Bailinhaonella thermotolerans]RJL33182.1 hypothetical protein D5H75_10075 [Bailinhaonella thermotolerans]